MQHQTPCTILPQNQPAQTLHGFMESFRLEKTTTITESSLWLITTLPTRAGQSVPHSTLSLLKGTALKAQVPGLGSSKFRQRNSPCHEEAALLLSQAESWSDTKAGTWISVSSSCSAANQIRGDLVTIHYLLQPCD